MLHFAAFHLETSFLFLAMDEFAWEKWTLLAAFLLDFFSKIIWESLITDQTLQISVPIICAFYPDSQTVQTLRSACIFLCNLMMLSLSNWDKQCNF